MMERTNAPGLSRPPGYSHAVVASGARLVTTAGAVPLDPEGNLVGPGDVLVNLALALDAASTLLGVSLLGYEGQLVEVEALAVLE